MGERWSLFLPSSLTFLQRGFFWPFLFLMSGKKKEEEGKCPDLLQRVDVVYRWPRRKEEKGRKESNDAIFKKQSFSFSLSILGCFLPSPLSSLFHFECSTT